MALTNESGNKAEEYFYDTWGQRKDPTNWSQNDTRANLILDRGYTGHEHWDHFSLINMNGRVYDPQLGRFLSPDNYIQSPGFSQSINRFTYCLNNPLLYTDPSGNTWWSHFTGWLGEQFNDPSVIMPGAFLTGTIPFGTFEVIGGAKFSDALVNGSTSWLGGLLTEGFSGADRRAHNSWKITKGLYMADDNSSDWNKVWQVTSRHTWQQPMTELGYRYANFSNNSGHVDVEYFHGATVIIDPFYEDRGAISIGGYIHLPPSNSDLDYNNDVLLHEYGHFIQTRQWGGVGFVEGGIFSLIDMQEDHYDIWIEQDANARTLDYFKDRMTSTEIYNFETKRNRPRQYYDSRFLRNYLFPELNILYFIDVIWPN